MFFCTASEGVLLFLFPSSFVLSLVQRGKSSAVFGVIQIAFSLSKSIQLAQQHVDRALTGGFNFVHYG